MKMEIVTRIGGPCIYKQGILEDGTETGLVLFTGQGLKEIQAELLDTLKTGRDDAKAFVSNLLG